jgi:hypothetical protein
MSSSSSSSFRLNRYIKNVLEKARFIETPPFLDADIYNEIFEIITSKDSHPLLKSIAYDFFLKYPQEIVKMDFKDPGYFWLVQSNKKLYDDMLKEAIAKSTLPLFIKYTHDGVYMSMPEKYSHSDKIYDTEVFSSDVIKEFLTSMSVNVCSQNNRFEKTLYDYEMFTQKLKYPGFAIIPRKYLESNLQIASKAFSKGAFGFATICKYMDTSFVMKVLKVEREFMKRLYMSPLCPVKKSRIMTEYIILNACSNLRASCPSFPMFAHGFELENRGKVSEPEPNPETNFVIIMELWKETLHSIEIKDEFECRQILFQIIHTIYFMQKHLKMIHCDLHLNNILLRDNCPPEERFYNVNGKYYKLNVTVPIVLNDFGFSMSEVLFTNKLSDFCKLRRNGMLIESGIMIMYAKPLFLSDIYKIINQLKLKLFGKFKVVDEIFDYLERVREERVNEIFSTMYGLSPTMDKALFIKAIQIVPDEMYELKPEFFEELLETYFKDFQIESLPSSSSLGFIYGENLEMIASLEREKPVLTRSVIEQLPTTFLEFPKHPFELDMMNWKEWVEKDIDNWVEDLKRFFMYSPAMDVRKTLLNLYMIYGNIAVGVDIEAQKKMLSVFLHYMNPDNLHLLKSPLETIREQGVSFVRNFCEKHLDFDN